jgi:hypothetical protein
VKEVTLSAGLSPSPQKNRRGVPRIHTLPNRPLTILGRNLTPTEGRWMSMKRFIQVIVTLAALAVLIWGAFFAKWRFSDQMMKEPEMIKEISNGICLS